MTKTFLFAIAAVALAADSQPRSRSFHMEYRATLKDIPAGAKHVDLWIPVPHDDPYQQIGNFRIESAHAYKIDTAPNGNAVLHLGLDRKSVV